MNPSSPLHSTIENAPEAATQDSAPSEEVSRLADHLFRHESGKLISILTGIFGIERLQMAEDVVQEALIRAMRTWPYYGIPKNPAAWLTQTAKNLALDLIRRERLFLEKQPEIIASIERTPDESAENAPSFSDEISDDRLRMMFACCHPAIPEEAQSALALNTLCGFSVGEIASAFLGSEAAIAKRLTRARQKIREARVRFEMPEGDELSRRLDAVLKTLYLMFNEGYKASSGEKLVREELCFEAVRIATLLAGQPVGNQPKVHALLALMLLNAARLATRTDSEGNLLRLKEQDRSRWDKALVARGMFHLARSASGDALTEYHLQAAIAACHCAARDFDSTDWPRILSFYDQWMQLDDSPVVALNRAVAVAQVHGPQAGIEAVKAIRKLEALDSYYLFHAALGEFEAQLKRFSTAADHFRRAAALAGIESEKQFLSNRLNECEAQRK